MRWFKHFADARLMPEIRNVERVLGEAGYARAHKLFEFIAQDSRNQAAGRWSTRCRST